MARTSRCWLVPAGPAWAKSTGDLLEDLLTKNGVFALTNAARGRSKLEVGDRLCFYAKTIGIVADARVSSQPIRRLHPAILDDRFCWLFDVDEVKFYLDRPVVLDPPLRSRLAALQGKETWSWLVHTIRGISQDDFSLLTRAKGPQE
jgi:hypothetical protein